VFAAKLSAEPQKKDQLPLVERARDDKEIS